MALRLELVFKSHLRTIGFVFKMLMIYGNLVKTCLIYMFSLNRSNYA